MMILPHAKACGVPLAIEQLHLMYAGDRACVNTLEQALDLCDLLGDGTGVAIDTYHVWWDPALAAQIARAGATNRIFAYHICDWLVPTQHMLTDRGMMGDGVINLPHIRTLVRNARLSRFHRSRDLFSRELVETARRRGFAHLHRTLQHGFIV